MYKRQGLVVEEIKTGDGCPKLVGIPMCLVVLICFAVPLIAHLSKKKLNLVYFFFTGAALTIAVVASIMQFMNYGECPKLDNGTPMCYLSFLIFLLLIILKIRSIQPININKHQ